MSTQTKRAAAAKSCPAHRLVGGLTPAREVRRGFIPSAIEEDDTPREISRVYGVHYGTACIWLRILRGPKRN